MLADGLENSVGANNVGFDKWPGVTQRIIIVTLGGKVHHNISVAYKLVYQFGIANVAVYEADFIGAFREIFLVPRVSKLVDNGNVVLRAMIEGIVNEVCPNKPRASRNK